MLWLIFFTLGMYFEYLIIDYKDGENKWQSDVTLRINHKMDVDDTSNLPRLWGIVCIERNWVLDREFSKLESYKN